MSAGSIVGILALKDFLSAKGVDKGCTSCAKEIPGQYGEQWPGRRTLKHTGSASTTDHQAELDTLFDIFLATDLMWNVRL